MSFVCWLGLVVGAAPFVAPVEGWSSLVRGATLPLSGAIKSLERDSDNRQNRWLSKRERWCRASASSSVEWREMTTLYDGVDYDSVEWRDQLFEFCGYFGFCERLRRRYEEMPVAFVVDRAFMNALRESLQIRMSDLSGADKGKRIAKFVEPWMTPRQIHLLFGESQNVLYGLSRYRNCFNCVAYGDYRVVVEYSCNQVKPLPAKESERLPAWECWAVLDEIREEKQEPIFDFWWGFTR